MDQKNLEAAVQKEKRRMIREIKKAKIPSEKLKTLDPIITNTAWMKVQLDEARDSIRDSELVVEYDNGGGQKGIRENPLYKGYEGLWRSYMLGMNRIIDSLPAAEKSAAAPAAEQPDKPENVLSIISAKHKRA